MNIARYIDSTLLNPTATAKEIDQLCADAVKYGFYSVCVNPYWVGLCTYLLQKHNNPRPGEDGHVHVCTVVDFPFGSGGRVVKECTAYGAIEDGADELDVVFSYGLYHSGDHGRSEAFDEIRNLVQAVNEASREFKRSVVLKIIIETCYLTPDEIVDVSNNCSKLGVQFIKTSTGYGTGGATASDVASIHAVIDDSVGVKASGGIKTYKQAIAMIEAGATRIGTSHALEIVSEWSAEDSRKHIDE